MIRSSVSKVRKFLDPDHKMCTDEPSDAAVTNGFSCCRMLSRWLLAAELSALAAAECFQGGCLPLSCRVAT